MQGLAEGDEQLEVPDAALGCRRPPRGPGWQRCPGAGQSPTATTRLREQPLRLLKRWRSEKEVFRCLLAVKAFRLTLWSRSQICSGSCRAGNSHFQRARQSSASRLSPGACPCGPAMGSTGLEGMGMTDQHRTPRCGSTPARAPAFTPFPSCERWSTAAHGDSQHGGLRGAAKPRQSPMGALRPHSPWGRDVGERPAQLRGCRDGTATKPSRKVQQHQSSPERAPGMGNYLGSICLQQRD